MQFWGHPLIIITKNVDDLLMNTQVIVQLWQNSSNYIYYML